MPLFLSEELIYTTVRIETVDADGHGGCGTGFFYQFAKSNRGFVPAIVTNRHVFQGALGAAFQLCTRNTDGSPKLGDFGTVQIDNLAAGVLYHPDPAVDLAVLPCGDLLNLLKTQGREPFLKAFAPSDVPTQTEMDQLGAVESVLMVGYPIGLWDTVNNKPIVRRGTTATHPAIDFSGRPEFLIDCACWPGSSGSPVVLYQEFAAADRSGNINMSGTKMKLLGVLFAGPMFDAAGTPHPEPIPTSTGTDESVHVPVNLGFVIKARMLEPFDTIARSKVSP